jgi:hypothetical protein
MATKPKGEDMTAKKVWSVIIIVVGVGFFFDGVSTYYVTDSLLDETRYWESQAPKSLVRSLHPERLEAQAHKAKTGGVLCAFLGITMAVGGTMWLNELKRKKRPPLDRTRDLDADLPLP